MKSRIIVAAAATLTLGLAACGGGGGVSASSAADAHGPIKIWYSNNPQEVSWGEQMVASWNKLHPSEKVTGKQIPAAQSSEEVIGAAITAGSEPCLIYNTPPAAGRPGVAQQLPRRWQLHPDAQRTRRQRVQVAERQLLPDAVEVEPGHDLLQQEDIRQGRHQHHQRVPGHGQEAGVFGCREVRHLPGAVE